MFSHVLWKQGQLYWAKTMEGIRWVAKDEATRLPINKAGRLARKLCRNFCGRFRVVESDPPSALFLRYRGQARYLARKVVKGPHLRDFEDEAESVLSVVIMQKWDKFDASRARRVTWLSRMIVWKLLTLRHKRLGQTPAELTPDIPDRHTRDICKGLSDEARSVIRSLMEDPQHYQKVICNRKVPKDERLNFLWENLTLHSVIGDKAVEVVFGEIGEVLYGEQSQYYDSSARTTARRI